MVRVAVVGAGPAGVYAAESLVEHGGVQVDVLDRLPCPFGLVRYGVAPDHPKLKSISDALQRILEEPAVRFLGNVEVGAGLTVEELRRHYDAVIYAGGAAVDRRLGIPGEDLHGSDSATHFVAWYSGHPDGPVSFDLTASSVAVIGVGNVAIDVTRMLAKSADELRPTDLPDHVLDALGRSKVSDIHLIGRRGPVQAKFTTKELRELGEVTNADMLVDPSDLELDDVSRAMLESAPALRRNLDVLREWAERRPEGRPRRVRLHFMMRPLEIVGDTAVSGLRLERTRLDATGAAVGTGDTMTLDVQMVLRSVGYRGVAMPGLPFDAAAGVIPNEAGRVMVNGQPLAGHYVAGWIKRGPTGLIGTNRRDAKETVTSLIADLPGLAPAPIRDPDAIVTLLGDRGVPVVTWQGWRAIELAEADLGRAQGRLRVKIADREALLRAAGV